MRVTIVAEFLGNIEEPTTFNSRFLTIADKLQSDGIEVDILTSDFIHNLKRHATTVSDDKGCRLHLIHEPGYTKNVSVRRFVSHHILARNLRFFFKKYPTPDLIYCAVPSLDFAYEAGRYSKKYGIPFIIDIQDLWPEAFEMFSFCHRIFTPLQLQADYIYSVADQVVGVSDTYCQRAVRARKKCDKTHTIYLGNSLSDFDHNVLRGHEPYKTDSAKTYIGYCGSLERSYDIQTVIDAVSELFHRGHTDIVLRVMGGGSRLDQLKAYSVAQKCPVEFLGYVPYPKMCSLLAECDIAVNPIVKGAAQSIINKHGDYACAGIPVVNSQECEEYRTLVDTYKMGLNCNCGDYKDMADKLERLIIDKPLRTEMGYAARRCAEECFDRDHTYEEIVKIIRQYDKGVCNS